MGTIVLLGVALLLWGLHMVQSALTCDIYSQRLWVTDFPHSWPGSA
jgi:hypothetical protein